MMSTFSICEWKAEEEEKEKEEEVVEEKEVEEEEEEVVEEVVVEEEEEVVVEEEEEKKKVVKEKEVVVVVEEKEKEEEMINEMTRSLIDSQYVMCSLHLIAIVRFEHHSCPSVEVLHNHLTVERDSVSAQTMSCIDMH